MKYFYLLKSSETYTKKLSSNLKTKKVILEQLRPPKLPGLWAALPPHPSPGALPRGPQRFWIESP